MTYKESESDFQSWVIDLAHTYGWLVAHFRPAKTDKGWRTPVSADGGGFFDLVLARNGKVLLVELKKQGGKLSPEQSRWQEEAGGLLWCPSDRDEIEKILK